MKKLGPEKAAYILSYESLCGAAGRGAVASQFPGRQGCLMWRLNVSDRPSPSEDQPGRPNVTGRLGHEAYLPSSKVRTSPEAIPRTPKSLRAQLSL